MFYNATKSDMTMKLRYIKKAFWCLRVHKIQAKPLDIKK